MATNQAKPSPIGFGFLQRDLLKGFQGQPRQSSQDGCQSTKRGHRPGRSGLWMWIQIKDHHGPVMVDVLAISG